MYRTACTTYTHSHTSMRAQYHIIEKQRRGSKTAVSSSGTATHILNVQATIYFVQRNGYAIQNVCVRLYIIVDAVSCLFYCIILCLYLFKFAHDTLCFRLGISEITYLDFKKIYDCQIQISENYLKPHHTTYRCDVQN